MKKLQRLIEIKRQLGLNRTKMERLKRRDEKLKNDHAKIIKSFTDEEIKLYKDRIEKHGLV